MVGSNSTSYNPQRRSFPWISKNKGKAEKACFCKLQSPSGRRRYLRRGSKTSKMLQAAKNELDESVRTCSTTPPSSAEFSIASISQELTLNSGLETSSVAEELLSKTSTGKQPSHVDLHRHSMSLLTEALAISSIEGDTEELDD